MEERAALRRKVLRGSLAAPVVLTVSSASVAAASFTRCLANTNSAPDAFFVNSSDQWFRTQVEVWQLSSLQGVDFGYFYEDPVKDVFVSINSPYTALNFNSGPSMPPNVRATQAGTRWAVVWFDKATSTQYSRITPIKPNPGASAVSVSCYGSFRKSL
jgi:hypothetical protein